MDADPAPPNADMVHKQRDAWPVSPGTTPMRSAMALSIRMTRSLPMPSGSCPLVNDGTLLASIVTVSCMSRHGSGAAGGG